MVQQALVVGDDEHGPVRRAERVHPFRDHLERVDVEAAVGLVENRKARLQNRKLEHFVALLLAAGETDIERALQHVVADAERARLLADDAQELHGVELVLAPAAAQRIERGAQEGHGAHTRNLDRILEGEEEPGGRALLRLQLQQVPAVIEHLAPVHRVALAAGEHIGERALAGPVRPHHGMHLAGADREIDPVQDRLALDRGVEIADFKHQPTDPSSEIPTSFWASTANSIGNCCSTSRQNPLTISATASSSPMPRWRQ